MEDTRLKIPVHGFGNFDANEEYEMIIWCWEQSLKGINEATKKTRFTYLLFHYEKRMEECSAFELLAYLRKQLSRKEENEIRKSINENNKKLFVDAISRKEARIKEDKRKEKLMRKKESLFFDNMAR